MLGACRGVRGATSQGCGKVACLRGLHKEGLRVDEPKPKMYTLGRGRLVVWFKFNYVDAEHAPEDHLVAPNP